MKPILISVVALLGLAFLFRPSRFTYLDVNDDNEADISWDEITEDLWP